MDIGFDTVLYVFLSFVGIPLIIWKPHLLIYFLIPINMFSEILVLEYKVGATNIYARDLILLFYCSLAIYIAMTKYINKREIFNDVETSSLLLIVISMYLTLHLIYIVTAILQGVPPNSAIRRFLTYSGCLYFFFPLLLINSKVQIRNYMIFIVAMSFTAFFVQIYTFLLTPKWAIVTTSSGTMRLGVGGIPIIASSLFIFWIYKRNVIYYIISVIPLLSIILVGHRSALLAFGAALIIFFLFTKKITKLLFMLYLLGFSLVFALIALETFTGHSFMSDTITRTKDTFNTENTTSQGRLEKIKNNYEVFRKRPLFGIGYNYEKLRNYINSSTMVLGNEEIIQEKEYDVLHPHNFLMRSLSHTGLAGTFLLMTIIYLSLKKCYYLIRTNKEQTLFGVFLFCSIVYFLTLSLLNTTFNSDGWFFWLLCGFAFASNIGNQNTLQQLDHV